MRNRINNTLEKPLPQTLYITMWLKDMAVNVQQNNKEVNSLKNATTQTNYNK